MKPSANLYAHQKQAVEFLLSRGGVGALFLEMGTGKTIAALATFTHLRELLPELRMVVICPLSLIRSAWGLDIVEYTHFTFFNAHDKKLTKDTKADIILINYESMLRNNEILGHIKNNLLVVDESSRAKNNRSLTTKRLLQLAKLPRFKIVMSGSPAPNSPSEYWGQMTFLDENILHKSFYGFRNMYFHLARNGEIMQGRILSRATARDIFSKGWKYEITEENHKKLLEKIKPHIFSVRKIDCLDLPDRTDEVRYVELSAEQKRHYKEMKRHLITEIKGQFFTAQVALAKIMKLREITSGFLMNGDLVTPLEGQAKIKELTTLLDELGSQQVIIWGNFIWEIQKIQALLGEKAISIYGETADKHEALEAFKAGKYQYLIANMASLSHGVTLTNCSTAIFYSLSYSLEKLLQARDRIHRIGQNQKCTYVYLLGKDTIDESIYAVLKNKGEMNSIAQEVLR